MNNKKVIVVVVGIIVVLSILLVVLLVKGNNQNVFVKLGRDVVSFIDDKFDDVDKNKEKALEEVGIKSKGKYDLVLKGNLDTNDKNMEDIKKILNNEYQIVLDYDLDKEVFESTVKLSNDKGELSGLFGADSENAYLKINDISEKYFYTKLDKNIFKEIKNNLDNKDNENTMNIFRSIYDDSKEEILDLIDKQDIDKTKETIKIGNKDKKVTKNALVLSEKLLDEISLILLKNAVKNEDFIDYYVEQENKNNELYKQFYSDYKEATRDSVKDEINEEIEEIEKRIEENKYEENNKDKYSITNRTLNIYTIGLTNKPVRFELESENKYKEYKFNDNNYMFDIGNDSIDYEYKTRRDVFSITFIDKDYQFISESYNNENELNNSVKIDIKNKGKGKYELSGENNDKDLLINGEFEYNKNKKIYLKLNLQNDEDENMEILFNLKFDKFTNKENIGKVLCKLSMNEKELYSFDINWEYNKDKSIKVEYEISGNDGSYSIFKDNLDNNSKNTFVGSIELTFGNEFKDKFEITINGKDKITIDISGKFTEKTNIEKRDLSNAINIEEDVSELSKFSEKLMNKLEEIGLYEKPKSVHYPTYDYYSDIFEGI